jgi:phytoene desaturase
VCGRDFDRDVDLRDLDPFYTIRFPDGSEFNMRQDHEDTRAEVKRLAPRDLAGFDKMVRDAEARYSFGFENLGRRPMNELWELIKVLPIFAWYRADRSVYAHAAMRMKDERLRMAMSFHPLFIGGDPFNVTSIYALVSHLEKEYGVHYAMGGVGAIAEAMANVVRGQGGRVRLNAEVDEIIVRGKKATGVRLTSGETLDAPVVVSNADAGHTYEHLMRKTKKRRWTPAKLARRRWSMGLFIWYFGTKDTREMWPDVGHHTILSLWPPVQGSGA